MNRDNRPLFTLTIEEFSELIKSIIAEEVQKLTNQIQDPNRDTKNNGDICLIEQACQITGLKKSTIYSKLSKKQIPSLTRRKPLLFSKKQLQMWIKAGRPKIDDPDHINVIFE
jgi:excisionase family DNA binding protein